VASAIKAPTCSEVVEMTNGMISSTFISMEKQKLSKQGGKMMMFKRNIGRPARTLHHTQEQGREDLFEFFKGNSMTASR
jgi:hypothetical protein